MSNMLGVSLIQFLDSPLDIVGLILIVFGISTVALAKRITRASRQTNDIGNDDKLYLTFKVIGLILLMAGFICIGINVVLYLLNK